MLEIAFLSFKISNLSGEAGPPPPPKWKWALRSPLLSLPPVLPPVAAYFFLKKKKNLLKSLHVGSTYPLDNSIGFGGTYSRIVIYCLDIIIQPLNNQPGAYCF